MPGTARAKLVAVLGLEQPALRLMISSAGDGSRSVEPYLDLVSLTADSA